MFSLVVQETRRPIRVSQGHTPSEALKQTPVFPLRDAGDSRRSWTGAHVPPSSGSFFTLCTCESPFSFKSNSYWVWGTVIYSMASSQLMTFIKTPFQTGPHLAVAGFRLHSIFWRNTIQPTQWWFQDSSESLVRNFDLKRFVRR
jgi:hypothetical protein